MEIEKKEELCSEEAPGIDEELCPEENICLEENTEPEFLLNEPFLTDLILLLDRMEKGEDDFSRSLREELLDILRLQGVEKIQKQDAFDPRIHRAIRAVEEEGISSMMVRRVIRDGYIWNGRVVRAMEVEVAKPCKKPTGDA